MKSIMSEVKQSKYELTDLEVIKDINQYVMKRHEGNAKLTLCRSRIHSQKDALHFIVESSKKLDVLDMSEICIYIQDKIMFRDVYIQRKDSWTPEVYKDSFSDEVEYTPENRNNIEKFIDRNFPQFSKYQQQLKKHGIRFSESEKMEMEEADMLGKAIVETCQREVEAHSPTKEEDIATLLSHIIRLAADRGLDSSMIIEQVSASRLTTLPVNK